MEPDPNSSGKVPLSLSVLHTKKLHSCLQGTLVVSFLLLAFHLLTTAQVYAAPQKFEQIPGETIDIRTAPIFLLPINAQQIETKEPVTVSVSTLPIKGGKSTKKNSLDTFESFSVMSAPVATFSNSNAFDNGLAYLRTMQTSQGNFGNASNTSSLVESVVVADLLNNTSRTYDDMFAKITAWLDQKYYESTYGESLRLLTLSASGTDVLYEVEPIISKQNEDGGFGYLSGYVSDPITTALVLRLIKSSGYSDPGENQNSSETQLLIYLLNTQNTDGGWGRTTDSISDILSTSAIVEALMPYKLKVVTSGGSTVSVASVLTEALAYIKQKQLTNGSWNNNLLETSRAYAILRKNAISLHYEDPAFTYLQSAQNADGGFGNGNVLLTAEVLNALRFRLLTSGPDVIITNIVTPQTLTNGTPTSVAVTIRNIGSSPVGSNELKIYNYSERFNWLPYGTTFLPQGSSLGVNEEVTVNVNLNVTNGYLSTTTLIFYAEAIGDTNPENNWGIKDVFFQGTNVPAMPLYYIAFEHESASGVRLRWPVEVDPARSSYVVLYRKLGSTTWNGANVSNTLGSANITGFAENTWYEVTLGARSVATGITTFLNAYTSIRASSNNYTGNINGHLTKEGVPLQNNPFVGYLISGTTTLSTSTNIALTGLQHGTNALWSGNLEHEKIVTKFPISIGSTTNIRVATRMIDDTTPPILQFLKIKDATTSPIIAGTSTVLEIGATDNVNTKEVDLSYFDSQKNIWVFIKTIPISGSIAAYTTFSWLIPEKLEGSGFMLRGIVRDHKGNTSAEVLYGPFTITGKTNIAPSLTFLEPNGVNDTSDTTFMLTWNDADPDSNARIVLYYDTDSVGFDGILIAENISEDVAINEYLWDTINIQNGTYFVYAKISDSVNPTTSVYAQYPITVNHPPTQTLPNTPTNLKTSDITRTSMTLTWNTPTSSGSKPITGYRIDRAFQNESNFATILSNTGTTSLRYIDTDLTPETTYQYRIAAVTEAGVGLYSKVATGTTLAPNIPPIFSFITPTGTSNIATSSFTISWNDADPDSNARIALYYETDSVGFDGIPIVSNLSEDSATNTYKWNTSTLPWGDYFIFAVIGDGFATSSLYSSSSIRILRIPKEPTNLSVSSVTPSSIRLTWKPPMDTGGSPITGYQILRAIGTSTTFATLVSNTATTATSYINSGLTSSTTYRYIVRTRTLAGVSTNTPPIATTTTRFNWKLFTDSLQSGWTRSATGSVISLPFTGKRYLGTASVRLSSTSATSTFRIRKSSGSQSTIWNTTLSFALQSSTTIPSNAINVSLLDPNGLKLTQVPLNTYGTSTLLGNTWYTYSIPLSVLGGLNRSITGVEWAFTGRGVYYLDEVQLR